MTYSFKEIREQLEYPDLFTFCDYGLLHLPSQTEIGISPHGKNDKNYQINLKTGVTNTNVGGFMFNLADLNIAGKVLKKTLQAITLTIDGETVTFTDIAARRVQSACIDQGHTLTVKDTHGVAHKLDPVDIINYELLWD